MKILHAKLKDDVSVTINLDSLVDFSKDYLSASAIVEQSKRKLVADLKNAYHEKIATLNVDDILFKIIN